MKIKNYIYGGLVFVFLLVAFVYLPIVFSPAEDAAILFQYSENFSETGIISYNKNGIRAEGATDFLWMILLGLFHFIGLDVYLSTGILSMASLLGTSYILFKLSNFKNISVYLFLTLVLLFFPTTPSAIVGFSTLFFGFFISLTTFFYIKKDYQKLFLSGLILCLVRPDGIVFCLPLFMHTLVSNRNSFKALFLKLLLYFIIPGTLYFIWRWNYFGHFLPLPFYVKSNFERFLGIFELGSLITNIKMVFIYLLPSILMILFSIRSKKAPRKIAPMFILIILIPFVFYSSMSLMQNVSNRFQYPMMLCVLLLLLLVIKSLNLNKRMMRNFILIQILFLMPAMLNFSTIIFMGTNNIASLSKDLNKITNKGRMLITEAGKLSYYSKWYAEDAWGLNTPKYSKRLITPVDVETSNFDLIVVHASGENYEPITKREEIISHSKRTWNNMTDNIFKGINPSKYTLYMVPFSEIGAVHKKLRSLKRILLKKMGKSKNYVKPKGRYDAYFIRNDFSNFEETSKILLKYKAISLDEYLQLE